MPRVDEKINRKNSSMLISAAVSACRSAVRLKIKEPVRVCDECFERLTK